MGFDNTDIKLREEFDRRRARGFDQLDPGQQQLAGLVMLFALLLGPEQIEKFGFSGTVVDMLGLKDFGQFRGWQDNARASGKSPEAIARTLDYSNFNFDKTQNSLLDLIAKHESNGDYNIVYGGKRMNLTSMTIDEVLQWQRDTVKQGAPSSAAGRYQFIRGTLDGLKKELGLSGNEKFDEKMQDRLATKLLERRGYSDFLNGKISEDTFMKRLSKEWASLPKDGSGKSFYEGDGLNRALVSPQIVRAAIQHARAQHLEAQNDKVQVAEAPKPAIHSGSALNRNFANSVAGITPERQGPVPAPDRALQPEAPAAA